MSVSLCQADEDAENMGKRTYTFRILLAIVAISFLSCRHYVPAKFVYEYGAEDQENVVTATRYAKITLERLHYDPATIQFYRPPEPTPSVPHRWYVYGFLEKGGGFTISVHFQDKIRTEFRLHR